MPILEKAHGCHSDCLHFLRNVYFGISYGDSFRVTTCGSNSVLFMSSDEQPLAKPNRARKKGKLTDKDKDDLHIPKRNLLPLG